jgi:hypothetical protein
MLEWRLRNSLMKIWPNPTCFNIDIIKTCERRAHGARKPESSGQMELISQLAGNSSTCIVHFYSSVTHVWVPGAKTTGPIVKIWFFLNLIFLAVRNFKLQHIFCRNKKFCSVKSRFPVHFPQYKFWTILALYPLFLGQFQWNFQIIIFSCPSTDVPRLVEKYPKIKYAISDRP